MSELENKSPRKAVTPEDASATTPETREDDVDMARRMLLKSSMFVAPVVLASFTVSKPVYAATCTPNSCDPGSSCKPDVCGPAICKPGSK